MAESEVESAYNRLQVEATALAGNLGDLAQRAATYHHLYRASQGNHVFPLIAAHGALWAGGHFQFGMKLGKCLSWQYGLRPSLRRRRLAQLAEFRDALRQINRQVCIDTYVNFHLSKKFHDHPELANFVPPNLLAALKLVHHACRRRRPLENGQRRAVFEFHFLHEQETIVGSTVRQAAAKFDWPLMKLLALRPRVRFSYLPVGEKIRFRNFIDQRERIENGLRAFDLAASVGWDHVEQSLQHYGLLPADYLTKPDDHFAETTRRLFRKDAARRVALPAGHK